MKPLLFLSIAIALLSGAGSSHAQGSNWKVVAPNILLTAFSAPGNAVEFGAIAANGKTVLAGWRNIALSLDGGTTWTILNTPLGKGNYVTDIAIYNDHTFAIMSYFVGAFVTYDQGATWQVIDNNSAGLSLVFDGSPTRIVTTHVSTVGYVIESGVIQSQFTIPSLYGSSIRVAADGTLRILGADPSNAWLYSSSDHGITWTRKTQLDNVDDYSFIADKTDPNRLVVINENWVARLGGFSNLFLTADNGGTWFTVYSQPLGSFTDLCGNGTAGCNDYFVGSKMSGILRSSDKGATWHTMGGPVTPVDSRSIAAVDDSLVFAIDTAGNIWATDIPPSTLGTAQVTGGGFFQQLSIATCDTSIIAPVVFTNTSCVKYTISKIQLIGKDSSLYTILGNLSAPFLYPDSVRIRFAPLKIGKTDAKLKVTYSNGSVVLTDLAVTVSPAPLTFSDSVLFIDDTIYLCANDTAKLILSSNCALDISSISLTGADTSSFILQGKKSGILPADSIITVRAAPKRTGNLKANLHIVVRDGRAFDIPMNLVVIDPPLSFRPPVLFSSDTISSCSNASATMILSAPCTLGIASLSIHGSDSTSFSILGKQNATLPTDSAFSVHCNPKHTGELRDSVRIVTRDGRIFWCPIDIVVTPISLTYNPAILFSGDTVSLCSSDSATLHLTLSQNLSGCAFALDSITIHGIDSASFSLTGKKFATLPADSLLKIICNPQHTGDLHATAHIVSADGRSWDVPLEISVTPPTPVFLPPQLFISDTILSCVSDSATLHLSSPCSIDLSAISIGGTDSSSFSIRGKNSASLPADSLLTILSKPQHSGKNSGIIHIIAQDGRSWNIPMSLFASDPPLLIETPALFLNDSVALCSTAIDSIRLKVACPLDISSVTFTGADAASFIVAGKTSYNLPADSVVTIECIPQHSGSLSASAHLLSAAGSAWDIPISLYNIPNPSITIDTITDGFTDVVGGDVSLAIVLNHSGTPVNAEFSVHYDTAQIIYQGVFDKNNTDHTVSHPDKTTSRVGYNSATDTLFARFSFYPVDSACTHVTIDSLAGAGTPAQCLQIISKSLTAEICSPAECGRQYFARFLRYGEMPQFSVIPNPTSGTFTISSSQPLGFVRISVIDRLGTERMSEYQELSPSSKFDLGSLPSGLYFIRVAGINSALPVIIEK